MDTIRHRIAAHRLGSHRFHDVASTVYWMGAVQAQDYGQAVWAIGARTTDATVQDVERAIEDRELVLTWPMRGTIHIVPARDAKWMTALMAPRRTAGDMIRYKQLGITEETFSLCRDVLVETLSGNKPIPRPDVLLAMQEAGIETDQQRGYMLLYRSAQEGLICFGPRSGKQQTFVMIDEWVKDQVYMSREQSLAEIARRYVRSHGPVTIADLARWTGMSTTDSRSAMTLAGDILYREMYEGQEIWQSRESAVATQPDIDGTYLLPGFDEYFIGYKDRSAIIDDQYSTRVMPGKNGIFKPIIVTNGKVVGLWKRTLKTKHVSIETDLFDHAQSIDIQDAAGEYARFMGLELRID